MKSRCLVSLFLLAAPSTLAAQVGLAGRVSTLGIGAELSLRARFIGIRLGGNYFQLSRGVTIGDNRYTATPHFENGTATGDLYPFGGSFHLSAGVILNYNEGRLAAAPPVTIDGRTYSAEEVSSLTGTVSFKRTAPYFGIGFAGQSRIALLVDLGVGLTGTPMAELAAESTLQGQERAELDSRIAREQQKVQDEIDSHAWLRYHPVLAFGLKLGF